MNFNSIMLNEATVSPADHVDNDVFPAAFSHQDFTFAEVEVDTQLLLVRSFAITLSLDIPAPLEIAKITYDYKDNEDPEYREVRALLRCVFHNLPRHLVNPPTAVSRNMKKFVIRYAKRCLDELRAHGCVNNNHVIPDAGFYCFRNWLAALITSAHHGLAWPGLNMTIAEIHNVAFQSFLQFLSANRTTLDATLRRV